MINTINWEGDCRATRESYREAIHRATREAIQISMSSSHLIQTN